MARRYLLRPLPAPGPCPLPAELAHHVGRVLRAKPGDSLRLFDGEGREAEARILRASKREVEVEMGPTRTVDCEPRARIELAVALPKGPRADWLFEHGTEIGVAVFRPILVSRSNRGERGDRWARIVAAATAQCDRSRLPEIRPAMSLQEMLAETDLPEERAVLAPGSDTELGATRQDRSLVLIGPEGGLSDEEIEALCAAGFARRGLGPLVMRVETAAMVAAARLLAPG